ncbi:MAG: aldehyde ferredoxin oxidoreductase family protein [Desulfobacterales bacterium]|nr:aldehyde ferredoxin oxidoreductase family protein [Desulfobacterales bacterium]
MREIIGTSNRILEVDLNTKTVSEYGVSERERFLFLGAKGLGLKLLYDRLKPGSDPLGPDNIIALMPGVLMGTGGPCSGRFETIAKSPLTGIMGTSSCGGPFGMALKTAGWDGLLISGKADAPTYLYITEAGVEFKDASHLWGQEIPETQSALEGKKINALVIGPAGENLVRFANIASGHRFSGRGGLGAVMGSKLLKAVVAEGGAFKVRPADPQGFAKARKKGNHYINQNMMTGDAYRKYGTAANVRPNLASRILPVHNFQDGWHQEGDQIAGETMAAKHKTSHQTCKPCSIMCGHKGSFNGETMAVPEYETVGLLGASIGIFDSDRIALWNQMCGRLGIDTISTGGTLAWVMEAAENGLVKSDLRFGSPQGVSQALEDIAHRRGFGDQMADGSRELANKYGGKAFAMHVKGLEIAAYDPRGSYGQGLSYAVANRGGCHLSAYMLTQELYFNLLKPDTTIGKARWVKFLEDLTCCVNALQACQFTMYAYLMEAPLTKYTPDFILRPLMQYLPMIAIPLVDYGIYLHLWNSVTGLRKSRPGFIRAGERIHVLERYMNTREGINRDDDTLPERFLKQGRLSDPDKKTVPLSDMLPQYYKSRGYDVNGIPTAETLRRLQIV